MCVCNDPARWRARCRQTTLASHISGMVGDQQTTLADQEFEIETYTAHDIGAEIQPPTKILTTAINSTAVSPITATLRWVARSAVNMDQFMASLMVRMELALPVYLPRCGSCVTVRRPSTDKASVIPPHLRATGGSRGRCMGPHDLLADHRRKRLNHRPTIGRPGGIWRRVLE